jgi:uncharacterized protein DUF5655
MGRECYHCKAWIEDGEAHDCWTTTEAALTADLPDELHEAWERIRQTAVEFGEQRIYASGTAIMFSRKSCYFFVRPRRSSLQVCVFLGRRLRAPQVRRVEPRTASKYVNIIHITHRDEVEPPITDWLREAFDLQDAPVVQKPGRKRSRTTSRARTAPTKKSSARRLRSRR